MSSELRIRRDSSERDRERREKLRSGCTMLLIRDRKMRSVLQDRDGQISELESQLHSLKAAKKPHLSDASTQLNGVVALEDRIEKLTEGLLTEKKRNQRIKHLIHYNDISEANVPPVPSSAGRSRSMLCQVQTIPVVTVTAPPRRRLVTQSIPISTFLSLKRPSKISQFLNVILSPPPIGTFSQSAQTNSAVWMDRVTQTGDLKEERPVTGLGSNKRIGDYKSQKNVMASSWLRSESPVTLLSPIGKVNHSFTIYEDATRTDQIVFEDNDRRILQSIDPNRRHRTFDISSPKKGSENRAPRIAPLSGMSIGQIRIAPNSPSPPLDIRLPIESAISAYSPPVLPTPVVIRSMSNTSTSNAMNYSSEEAIKRAVTAAINKRKKLAAMGVSLGSARSLMSSTSSFVVTKPRFGCIPETDS